MKRILFFIMFFVAALAASSQTLNGMVMDSKGKPKKGVQLHIQGNKKKIKSKSDGTFSLPGAAMEDSVIVKGNKGKEAIFSAGDLSDVKIIINDEHVMVNDRRISYMPRKEFKSGDVLTRKDIKDSGAQNFADAIIGRISGVQRMENGLNIRGINTINSKNEPLYILDGTETSFDALYNLDIETIEKIEVNKTGFGYGMKGSNGAIIVTTRKI